MPARNAPAVPLPENPLPAWHPTCSCTMAYGGRTGLGSMGPPAPKKRGAGRGEGLDMGYRIFRDSTGTEWQAWDIIPRLEDRRARERRLAMRAVAIERRATEERRLVVGERPRITNGLNAGWLCFEAIDQKRRLTPIPADWLRCAVARLEEYLRAAIPARRVSATEPTMLDSLGRRAG